MNGQYNKIFIYLYPMLMIPESSTQCGVSSNWLSILIVNSDSVSWRFIEFSNRGSHLHQPTNRRCSVYKQQHLQKSGDIKYLNQKFIKTNDLCCVLTHISKMQTYFKTTSSDKNSGKKPNRFETKERRIFLIYCT